MVVAVFSAESSLTSVRGYIKYLNSVLISIYCTFALLYPWQRGEITIFQLC